MEETHKKDKMRIQPFLYFLIGVVATLTIVFFAVTPKTYSISEGDVAPETIIATKEVVDELSTEENKKKASDAVAEIYMKDPSVSTDIGDKIDDYFEDIEGVRKRAQETLTNLQSESDADFLEKNPDRPVSENKKLTYEEAISDEEMETLMEMLPFEVEAKDIFFMLNEEEQNLIFAKGIVKQYAEDELSEGVREDQIEVAKSEILEKLKEIISSEASVEIAYMPIEKYFTSNSTVDEEATKLAKQKAEDAAAPVVYKKGQAIVREGEILTDRQIEMLKVLGMLAGGLNLRIYAGAFLSVIIASIACFVFAKIYEPQLTKNANLVLMIGINIVFSLAIAALLAPIETRALPLVFVPLAISITLNATSAIVFGIATCAITGFIMIGAGAEAVNVFSYMLAGVLACPVAAISSEKFNSRTGVVLASILAGIVGILVYVVVGLQLPISIRNMIEASAYILTSCIVSAVLCLGLTPLWEMLFQILTPMKLMELCNSTNPLLKRMALEAPGTYYHATMVANLAESAAEEVGANALLARAGAYYHDVGKLKAPMYYKENQGADNPHDLLPPEESARIIAMHTVDGYNMLLQARIPQPIADIALQHHGTYLMGYFYKEALDKYGEVDENDYRHIGGLPTTKEAAIVMLADAVEAAVRSDSEDYSGTIRKIIRARLLDGQLDRAPLTLVDISRIGDAFDKVLTGAYHNRIKYPALSRNEERVRALEAEAQAELRIEESTAEGNPEK